VVDAGHVRPNVLAYLRHVEQHRGSMRRLDGSACVVDEWDPAPAGPPPTRDQSTRPPASKPLK
jgi:hypothetical protein